MPRIRVSAGKGLTEMEVAPTPPPFWPSSSSSRDRPGPVDEDALGAGVAAGHRPRFPGRTAAGEYEVATPRLFVGSKETQPIPSKSTSGQACR